MLPLGAYLYLKLHAHMAPAIAAPAGHFQAVSAAAILGAVLAVAVGVAGIRLRNMQVTFLAMAFTSLALVFALHGLATPGFLMPMTNVPSMAAPLSVLLTAFWLWLSALPGDLPVVARLAGWQRWLVPVWAGLLVLLVAALMHSPGLVNFLPIQSSPLKWVTLAVTVGLNLAAARHYWRAYRYSHFPLQFAILCSIGWLAGAQVIIVTSQLWHASWWIYHFLLLAAMVLMLSGLARQYATGTSIGTAVRSLLSVDPVERIEAGIAPSIRALVIATELRDRYTAGHSYRVAIWALRLGEALGLPPEQLRALAQGGIIHDVGKIEVPDQVLNKPGRLTPDEREIIEKHPVAGFDMCKRLGFLPDELAIIRHHHERWDGTGYPDRLMGEQIPLLARVLAIADVYDALTSTRSYRAAWSHDRAMALILEESGKAFDPACVAAWVRLMAEEPALDRYPSWMTPQADLV